MNEVSFTNLELTVLDVNDHPPVFEKPTYTTTILEEDHVTQPKKILQVPRTNRLSYHTSYTFDSFLFVVFKTEISNYYFKFPV